MTDLLTIRDLRVDFRVHGGIVRAVRGVSFSVPKGGSVALVGESGSGKTVVSQAIMGILPDIAEIQGEILFNDPMKSLLGRNGAGPGGNGATTDIAKLGRDSRAMRAIRGGRISIIFQEPMTSLSPLHTVGNQVTEALRLHRDVPQREAEALVEEMLRLVGFPDPKRGLNTYPFELSGGLRQRAMIAMALVCNPALLIADEPTTALDVTIQAQILKLIKDLQQELGMALLLITHDLGVVANMADEVVVMYHGEVMEGGPAADIYKRPEHPYLKALMRAVPRFDMKPGERLVPLREITAETGHLLAAKEPWPEAADKAGPMLKVEHISKTFRIKKSGWFGGIDARIKAVADVSFEIKRGECVGLVGESGCGKTTLSKILMRALSPDQGKITFNDRGKATNVLTLRGGDLIAFRRRMQFMFQDPFGSLNPRMTLYDIISEPLRIHSIGDEKHRAEMVQELLRLVGLDPRFLNRYPHSFSGGQRQRIGIARALALKPDLLICDEPVSALDVSVQAQVLNLLKDLQSKLGLTYLFISHNLAVVDYMADRIAVMCAGRIVELSPSHLLFQDPRHPYTKALLAAVPEPDPGHRLDLSALMEGKASIPAAWPEPFTVDDSGDDTLHDLGGGHFVRARKGAVLGAMAA
jgi:peptide/nickel transport system ATP-binding protein